MSAKSWLLAHGGIVCGYDVQESAGTTLDDFGSNNLDATTSTRAAVGGAAVLPEEARAVTLTGLVGAGAAATRAVSGGSPLQLSTAFTYLAFLKPSTVSPTGTRGSAGGRNNNWQLRWNTNGSATGIVWIGGSPLTLTGVTAMPTTQTSMVALSFDGLAAELTLNAVLEDKKASAGTINATTDSLDLWYASSAFDGLGGLVAVLDHKLSIGELRELLREANSALDLTTTAPVDFVGDAVPVIAASSAASICGPCQGRMRANERRVVSGGKTMHAECHWFNERGGAPVINASASEADYALRAEHFAREALNYLARRPTTGKTVYHDGTMWRSGLTDLNSAAWMNTANMGVLAAILARRTGAGPRSPLVEHARRDAAVLVDNIDANGYLPGDDFSQNVLGQLCVMLDGVIPASEHNALVEEFLRTAEFFHEGGVTEAGVVKTPEGTFYTNGNREGGELVAFGCAAIVSGTQTWVDRAATQLTFMVGPTSSNVPALNGGSQNGWKQVSGSGVTGKGFFREAGGNGFYLWNDATNFKDGYDPNYTHLALSYMLRYWLISGDANALPYLYGMHNQLMDSVSSWTLDGTLGTRQHNTQPFYVVSQQALTWGAALAATGANQSAQFLNAESQLRGLMKNPAEATYREIALVMGSLLMAADGWPGV